MRIFMENNRVTVQIMHQSGDLDALSTPPPPHPPFTPSLYIPASFVPKIFNEDLEDVYSDLMSDEEVGSENGDGEVTGRGDGGLSFLMSICHAI